MAVAKTGLSELYDHIMRSAQLDEFHVVNKSPTLGAVSFLELDTRTRTYVMPIIEDLDDAYREKARFMLDVAALNILRKTKDLDSGRVIAIDVHMGTLIKTSFRSRYLVVLADFIKNTDYQVLLNIQAIPVNIVHTRLCDLLRYLMPIVKNVSLQVSQDNILTQDLRKITVRHFTLSVPDLTSINGSMRRDITLARLSKFPEHNKEIIVRNVTETVVKQMDDAFYL